MNKDAVQGKFVQILELETYAAGIYFVTIQSGKDVVTRKIVKE